MSRRAKYSIEQKVQASERYLQGKASAAEIAAEMGMPASGGKRVREWAARYRENGIEGFHIKEGNRSYTAEEKQEAVHFLDVGQADAAVLLCDDQAMLIDGGNAADSSLLYSYLKNTLGVKHIDYIIASHPHEDHIGGLSAAINACTVGTIYTPVTEYSSEIFKSLRKYATQQNIPLTVPTVGDSFEVGSSTVTFLSTGEGYSDPNNQSLVARIVYGDTSFLFTGDAEWDPEHDMVEAGYDLPATLLKVGHHGSSTSTSYVFLREIMPQYAVISVGAGNSYGHPCEDTLSRLHDEGATVFRTDLQGTIVCYSDGQQLSFKTTYEVTDPAILFEGASESDVLTSYDESEDDVLETLSDEVAFVGNLNTKKFHYPDCSYVGKMNESNKVEFSSRDDAITAGYVPCKSCDP